MLLRAGIEIAAPGSTSKPARAFARNAVFPDRIGPADDRHDRISADVQRPHQRRAVAPGDARSADRRVQPAHVRGARRSIVIAEAARGLKPLSLLAVDIDHFKHVNDEFGHEGGDEALRLVVALMQRDAGRRPDPEPHRRRGIRGAAAGRRRGRSAPRPRSACVAIWNRSRDRCRRPRAVPEDFGGRRDARTRHSRSSRRLLRAADRALYAAKRAGRNRVATSSALAEALRLSTARSSRLLRRDHQARDHRRADQQRDDAERDADRNLPDAGDQHLRADEEQHRGETIVRADGSAPPRLRA